MKMKLLGLINLLKFIEDQVDVRMFSLSQSITEDNKHNLTVKGSARRFIEKEEEFKYLRMSQERLEAVMLLPEGERLPELLKVIEYVYAEV